MVVKNNINFTGRCPQIKDAQWVCHNVSTQFPYISTTRLAPFICNLEDKYPKVYDQFISANPAAGKFAVFQSESEKKIADIFAWMKRLIRDINMERENRHIPDGNLDMIRMIIQQMKNSKLGNCYENAKISEAIMRVNGHENVYTGALKVGDRQIDHVVCFFNKDGSPFDGKVNKNTIIIDSWLNETDFADNMLLKYRNRYKDFLFIPKDGKLSFKNVETLNLSKEELAQLASEFPQLLK